MDTFFACDYMIQELERAGSLIFREAFTHGLARGKGNIA
jgi:hypothetical protein